MSKEPHFSLQLENQTALLQFQQRVCSVELLQELEQALHEIELSPEVRTLVMTGSDDTFLLGLTPSQLASLEPVQIQTFLDYLQQVLSKIENFSKPVIAAVNGLASGLGFELVLSCHLLLASEEARFALPELETGYLPLGGGIQRLLRKVGAHRTLEIVLGGYQLTAQDVYEWGLLNHIFAPELLLEKAFEMAALFKAKAPVAVRQALRAVAEGQALPLPQALQMESHLNALCWNSSDLREGIQAALEQRPPVFRAR